MKQQILSFSDIGGIAEKLSLRLQRLITEKHHVNIAVSGGNTPLKIFEKWRDDPRIDWSKISVFWVDERMVPTHSDESNYGNALRIFQQNPAFPLNCLHPMPNENGKTADLASVYQAQIEKMQAGAMELILLGIGDDGHTASIFPGQEALLTSDNLVAHSLHPDTKQERITLTGKTIFQANKVIFIATGANKRLMLQQIADPKFANIYPASYVFMHHRNAIVYADTAAIK